MDQAIIEGVHLDGETQLGLDTQIALERSWLLETLERGEIALVKDISTLTDNLELAKTLTGEGLNGLISVPLVAQGELMGALNLGFSTFPQMTDRHHQTIRQLADQLAIGLHQNQLQQAIKHYTDQLEERVARRTASLRASEARFRTVFEDSAFGIALLDARGKIVDSNPALQEMCGYSKDELGEMTIFDPDLFARTETTKEMLQNLVAGDLDFYQREETFCHQGGRERWWQLTISRVQSSQNIQPRLLILMAEDITEKRANQEALIRSERLTLAGQLGASLAHEINNPLQSVIGCLGLAEEMLEDGDQVHEYLEIAMEELERAAEIVNQLRDLSRPAEPLEKQLVDLNSLVDKVLFLTRKHCQNTGIELVWDPADRLPLVPLVAERIQQVCLNLVLNAVAAMPEGGDLRVSTHLTGSPAGVRLTFSDVGIGIKPDQLSQIFEPFHSTHPEGLGLGLYISKKIVEEHSGRIEVESHPGEGATFHIWLPL
jgi:PAS domain S-box-containing protein